MLKPVIVNGYCIGCGACTASSDSLPAPVFDEHGLLTISKATDLISAVVNDVCPFSGNAADEDQISAKLFAGSRHNDAYLGRYEQLYAGFVASANS